MDLPQALMIAVTGLVSALGLMWRSQLAAVKAQFTIMARAIVRLERKNDECEADRKQLWEQLVHSGRIIQAAPPVDVPSPPPMPPPAE